jgi:tagatose 6-phosphate kinase
VIVPVTLNPALHVHYEADRVVLGAANRVGRVRYEAGGRGLAVARLLNTFGHDVVAAGLAGGSSGELIRIELAKAGVATQFTRITAESRRVVRVADAEGGLLTSFEEPAPYITTEELGRLAADYRALLDGATAVVLCGSLPAGLPAETYGSLTSYATGAGVPVILDAGGSVLRHGAARGPALVIPDGWEPARSESAGSDAAGCDAAGPDAAGSDAAGSDAAGSEAADRVAAELMAAGASSVVLLTEGGMRAVSGEGQWHAAVAPPGPHDADGQAAAGRRDALVAGFVPGIALGWSWPDMLRHAVALSASVTADGEADLAAYEKLLPQVTVAGRRP